MNAPEQPGNSGPLGTIASLLVFLGGALTTLLTLVSDFGADSGGLAAARRNHGTVLVIAAALATAGMLCAAGFAVARRSDKSPGALLGGLLLAGVAFVLAGSGLGITATVDRDPGDVTIAIKRVSLNEARVTITGEGFPSDKRFEAVVTGYNNVPNDESENGKPLGAKYVIQLARGRLSPVQSGEIDWAVAFDLSTPVGTPAITYLLVVVHDAEQPATSCNLSSENRFPPTCVYARLAPPPPVPET